MPDNRDINAEKINNAGSDAESDFRRSGGSASDPHGGHEDTDSELDTPEPDPIRELVPGGQGAEAPRYTGDNISRGLANQPVVGGAGNDGDVEDLPAENLAYTEVQKPNLPAGDSAVLEISEKVQGSGRLVEPVERRANDLVFDSRTGNFSVKDEEHGTGVTSQDKT